MSSGPEVLTVKFFSKNPLRLASTRVNVEVFGRLAKVSVSRKISHGGIVDSKYDIQLTVKIVEVSNDGRVLGPLSNVEAHVGMSMLAGPGRSMGGGSGLTDSNGIFIYRYGIDLHTYRMKLGDPIIIWGSMQGLFANQLLTSFRV